MKENVDAGSTDCQPSFACLAHCAAATSARAAAALSTTALTSLRCALAVMLLCSAASEAVLPTARADEAAAGAARATLVFADHDRLSGELVDSPHTDRLLWKSSLFAAPLEVPLAGLKAIYFPVVGRSPQPEGAYCFEMAGGHLQFGALVALSDKEVVIDATGFGKLHVDRAMLHGIYHHNGKDLIYAGPTGLAGWQASSSDHAWQEDGGRLSTAESGATLRRDFNVPPLARFEIDLSWQNKADFDLALGVGDDPKSLMRAFRLDVWDTKLVAWRETDRDADVTPLMKLEPGPGHVHLLVLLDQNLGRMLVFSAACEQIADLQVGTGKNQVFGGVQLMNRNGDVQLERLRIGRWTGETPKPVDADKARIHAVDGTIAYGQLKSYDAATRQFVIDGPAGEKRLDEDQVQNIFLSREDQNATTRTVSATYLSGVRVSGDLLKIEGNKLWLACPGIREPIAAPIAELYALSIVTPAAEKPPLSGREGRLECQGFSLHGCLTDSRTGDACCLVWRPRYCTVGQPLAAGVRGRIVYQDRAPSTVEAPDTTDLQLTIGPIANAVQSRSADAYSILHGTRSKCVLHLRYGDYLPCDVEKVDEVGVTFTSPVTDATFVRHEQVQALELMPAAAPGTIAKEKKERLLTLPRMQRDNPPTQLIRSIDGDYLRGRLTAMDEKTLQLEWRLETKTLQRARVARIIWLYPDETASSPPAAVAGGAPSEVHVQVLAGDGKRLTFVADRFAGTTLSGRSELLGACHADVNAIDELLIGSEIEQEAAKLAFHQWQLKPAPDPLAAPDGESGEGASEGLDSALVGKPAPDFQIPRLEGGPFHLADHKKSVVVIDFWASWCGPCLQTMPQVDKVVDEFAEQGVKLLAINLEEAPEQIKTALERLELDMPVGLDRDGRVAEKYGATAIPQTVIVDREGKVARLFVGGSARFDEQLREALKSVLADAAPQTE